MRTLEAALNAEYLDEYLWHGYLIDPPPSWLTAAFQSSEGDFDYSLTGAIFEANHVFDNLSERLRPPFAVPVSGGLDSRFILASLRQRFTRSEILAFSYGTPGQLDYELGKHVSDFLDVPHHPIDIRHLQPRWSELVSAAGHSPWTYVPDGYINQEFYSTVSSSGVNSIWIGFLGEAVTGAHLSANLRDTSVEEIDDLFADGQYRSREFPLSKAHYRPRYERAGGIGLEGPKDFTSITRARWLDLAVRQYNCVAPIVLPGGGWSDLSQIQGSPPGLSSNLVAPFSSPRWVRYWLRAPLNELLDQRLYLRLQRQLFPDLYRTVPTKNHYGLPAQASVRRTLRRAAVGIRNKLNSVIGWPSKSKLMLNYFDFGLALRVDSHWRRIGDRSIDVLHDLDAVPWVSARTLWNQHLEGHRDLTNELLLLIGLAVNLSAHDS